VKFSADELIGEARYLLRVALDETGVDAKLRREIIKNHEKAVKNEYKYLLREAGK
jgi:hypothetical protein